MKKTTIVNIRNTADYDVYIGRAGRTQGGYFGNPFKLKPGELKGSTIAKYRSWFYNRLKTDLDFRNRIHDLKGKTLGCFCKPHMCHGDVIKEYLDTI